MIAIVVAVCMLAAVPASAAEAWFLPYEPDADTLILLHLDAEGEVQPNAGSLEADGVLADGAASTAGMFGGGALLEGAEEEIRVPSGDLRLDVGEPFTVEAWMRPDGTDGNVFSIAINYYLTAHYARGTATFGYRAESFPIRWYSMAGVPWRRGQWQHVALTHNADRVVRLFIDGRLVAETRHADEGTYTEKPGNTHFGSHDGWRDFFRGAFDEIRVSAGVREFAPLLTERVYLDGEAIRLDLGRFDLPRRVAVVQARVLDAAGEELAAFEGPPAEASQPLVSAAQLGEGEGSVEVAFLDAEGQVISRIVRPVAYGGRRATELQRRAEAVEDALTAGRALPDAMVGRRLLAAVSEEIERRSLAQAEQYLQAAERRAQAVTGGEAAYRRTLRRRARAVRDDDVRITMSWAADNAAAALPWAERLGANELVTPHGSADRDGLALWRAEGYHTAMLSSLPMRGSDPDRPDHAQFGYWYMQTPPAEGETVSLTLEAPEWGGLSVSDHFPPAEHWLVVDAATDERMPARRWEYDHPSRTVTMRGAEAGDVFGVYYMIATNRIGDPLYEPFAEHALAELEAEVAPLAGVLETFWYDDLGYAWPGRNPQGGYDWESYTNAARPENQRAFEEETRIEFDPRWLVMPPRTLDVPPEPEYLTWMRWVQERLKPWMRRATDVVHDHGVRTWLYWGDAHVGIEPYLGSLAAANLDEVDKPSGDPVTARALVDLPGGVYRRMRVEWLHSHLVARADGPEVFARRWDRARRGLLMQPPEGLYWMPMPNVTDLSHEAVREAMVEQLAQISDEFRLIARELGRVRGWEGAANVYVVHSWGRQYSWRPWADRVLWHLTDLPVRVRFISFREVIDAGVPDDAHCLFLYGLPGSAWSGGYIWEDERLTAAVEGFVRGGGGLVAVQAPSALEDGWALSGLLGVDGAGSEAMASSRIAVSDDEWIDPGAVKTAREGDGPALVKVAEGVMEGAAVIPGMQETVRAGAVTDDVTVAWGLVDGEQVAPGVTLREVGEGRAAWLAGCSPEYRFSRLLRSIILWASRREEQAGRLDVSGGEELFAWAYPEAGMIALLSTADEPADASVTCDPAIIGAEADATVTDVVTGETLGSAAELSEGLPVRALPHCTRLLRAAGD